MWFRWLPETQSFDLRRLLLSRRIWLHLLSLHRSTLGYQIVRSACPNGQPRLNFTVGTTTHLLCFGIVANVKAQWGLISKCSWDRGQYNWKIKEHLAPILHLSLGNFGQRRWSFDWYYSPFCAYANIRKSAHIGLTIYKENLSSCWNLALVNFRWNMIFRNPNTIDGGPTFACVPSSRFKNTGRNIIPISDYHNSHLKTMVMF